MTKVSNGISRTQVETQSKSMSSQILKSLSSPSLVTVVIPSSVVHSLQSALVALSASLATCEGLRSRVPDRAEEAAFPELVRGAFVHTLLEVVDALDASDLCLVELIWSREVQSVIATQVGTFSKFSPRAWSEWRGTEEA